VKTVSEKVVTHSLSYQSVR